MHKLKGVLMLQLLKMSSLKINSQAKNIIGLVVTHANSIKAVSSFVTLLSVCSITLYARKWTQRCVITTMMMMMRLFCSAFTTPLPHHKTVTLFARANALTLPHVTNYTPIIQL